MKIKTGIIYLFITILLFGCSPDTSSSLSELLTSLENNLSTDDKVFLKNLQSHVKKFEKLNQELEMVLDEMKNDDDLEAGIDTLEIAKQEALYIYNLIELEAPPKNTVLKTIQKQIQSSIDDYVAGMNTQLIGITTGNTKKTDKGYQQISQAKNELQLFLTNIKKMKL